jgi:hypothetical protein
VNLYANIQDRPDSKHCLWLLWNSRSRNSVVLVADLLVAAEPAFVFVLSEGPWMNDLCWMRVSHYQYLLLPSTVEECWLLFMCSGAAEFRNNEAFTCMHCECRC